VKLGCTDSSGWNEGKNARCANAANSLERTEMITETEGHNIELYPLIRMKETRWCFRDSVVVANEFVERSRQGGSQTPILEAKRRVGKPKKNTDQNYCTGNEARACIRLQVNATAVDNLCLRIVEVNSWLRKENGSERASVVPLI
jgi:hypothetical protein